MKPDSLIHALPDLVTFIRRNGVILRHLGGRGLKGLADGESLEGRRVEEVWGPEAGQQVMQMVRRALSSREQVEGRFGSGTLQFEARVEPVGPERVLCVIRTAGKAAPDTGSTSRTDMRGLHVDRRGFLGRLKQSVADAALRESPLAAGMIMLRGIGDIGSAIDFSVAESVATTAMQRLQQLGLDPAVTPRWYLGQLGEGLLAVVVEGFTGREAVRDLLEALCRSLAEPVRLHDATFELSPCAGIALLGHDAGEPRALLAHARSAMLEARRSALPDVRFYSDTLRVRPVTRLDFERELREAIAGDQLCLRYAARHDFATGRLVGIQAYLRWPHPLRGEVRPAEFLPVGESTGLSTPLSRWALGRLRRDLGALLPLIGPQTRISFGALRHHLSSDTLAGDVEEFLASGALAPGTLELRVDERTLAGLGTPDRTLGRLADLGAFLVLDEFGRGFTSLARLVHLPFQALQVDRSFVTTIDEDPAALRVCQAAAGIARALGLTPVASGVDSERDLYRMREAGFEQGLGDLYGTVTPADAVESSQRAAG
jgi:predicted signal transduction protein with EAL and GGDEF domain